jgi:multidrug efflux pump subunit AcrB
VGEINANLASFIEQEGLKQRFNRLRILFSGELEQQAEALGNGGIAFMVCMFGIFFLLSLLFNSLSQPFLVISVIPFGFMGVRLHGCHRCLCAPGYRDERDLRSLLMGEIRRILPT